MTPRWVVYDEPAGGGGGGPWDPSQLAGLDAWYDADDASTLTLNGSAVSGWSDKSGNAHDASQATQSLQPALTSGGLNGRDVITLTQDYLSAPSLVLTGVGHQVFVVATLESSSNAWAQLVSTGAQWVPVRRHGITAEISSLVYHGTPSTTVGYGSAFIAAAGFTTVNEFYVDGQIVGTGPAGSINAADGMQIGSVWNGLVAELIVCDDQTASEREKVEGYLAHKWGLAGNLPVSHPYKNAAP